MIGKINSIQTLGLVDGPGIRVVIFLQGCPLRCIFCHNPETWNNQYNLEMTPKQTLDFIKKYKNYFDNEGGVTFSGGEPLMQPQYLLETLKLCKDEGINTCLDTSGFYTSKVEEILKYTDLVILDIKAIDEINYKKITNKEMTKFKYFFKKCQELNKNIWLRQVIIPGINDNLKYIYKLKEFIKNIKNVKKIELLPYHTMAVSKYDNLNIDYPLKNTTAMDKMKCEELERILNQDR